VAKEDEEERSKSASDAPPHESLGIIPMTTKGSPEGNHGERALIKLGFNFLRLNCHLLD